MPVAAFLFLLQATAAPAPAPAAPSAGVPAAGATSAPKVERKICKSSDVIGSRVQKRAVCMTKAQWDGVGRDAREMTRTMQDRLTGGAPH